ncbi:hypothetical protein M153_2140008517 [Pseudoloma neurophilia]|uniref:Uncharacterized protein n=1 Tax=Pseudoloma neurophilia TaxID=146866 RepID=A0A0R0LZ06_9MICR|nr:hypothetical protein M153_2140008517 [Pseudoloma neurophilia]
MKIKNETLLKLFFGILKNLFLLHLPFFVYLYLCFRNSSTQIIHFHTFIVNLKVLMEVKNETPLKMYISAKINFCNATFCWESIISQISFDIRDGLLINIRWSSRKETRFVKGFLHSLGVAFCKFFKKNRHELRATLNVIVKSTLLYNKDKCF